MGRGVCVSAERGVRLGDRRDHGEAGLLLWPHVRLLAPDALLLLQEQLSHPQGRQVLPVEQQVSFWRCFVAFESGRFV